MPRDASELAHRLAREAEAVCRHYLSNGRREGRYWLVGDVRNTPGRSMFVRLKGPEAGRGAAGKWTEYVAPRVMLRLGRLGVVPAGDRRLLRNIISAHCGGFRDAPRRFRAGAAPRARRRGGMPPLPVQRAAPGPLLDGGRRSQHARPVDVRPAQRAGSGPGAAGHWTDAASAEHGDLLDVIRESCGLVDFRDVADEARRFLSLPRAEPDAAPQATIAPRYVDRRKRHGGSSPCRSRSGGRSSRAYLRNRGITGCRTMPARCASTRAATIARTRTRRPRPGRR